MYPVSWRVGKPQSWIGNGNKQKTPYYSENEMQRKFLFTHLMEEDHLEGPKQRMIILNYYYYYYYYYYYGSTTLESWPFFSFLILYTAGRTT
jgi:hypothetical protein